MFKKIINFFYPIYKIFNKLYKMFLKDGVCGLMFVFIEEDLIIKSIESAIPFLNKLVIVIDKNLETYKVLSSLRNNKIKIITIKKVKKHFSYYINKAYKKCNYKFFTKIDADQIYIKNNINESIKYCRNNENTIALLSGVNIHNINGKIVFLKGHKAKYKNIFLKNFNGGVDHWVTPKKLLSKFTYFYFDNREIEKYIIPYFNKMKKKYFGMNWVHYGSIKIGINPDSKVACNFDYFLSYCKRAIICKNFNEWYLNEGLTQKKLDNFKNFYLENFTTLSSYIYIYNEEHIKNTKHQMKKILKL